MSRGVVGAGLVAILSLGLTSPSIAGAGPDEEATMAAGWVLGSANEDAPVQAYLPFTRQFVAGSRVTGSLADSATAAGVPAATMLEALRALGTAIDLERDLRNGDRFHVRYEQTFIDGNQPIGAGRVLWLELQTRAKGTIALHRFRDRAGVELFWLASGKAAAPPMLRQPLGTMAVTSAFGLRTDPLDHPATAASIVEVVVPPSPVVVPETPAPEPKEVARARVGLTSASGSQLGSARDAFAAGGSTDIDRIMAMRRLRAREEAEKRLEEEQAAANRAAAPVVALAAVPPVVRKLFMHQGVDLLAPTGAPIHAATDGVVIGAASNGRYGNWIRIKHSERLTTVYGHLSGFAHGIEPGTPVARGELIGFVGSTGRSTGAHLHYEVLIDGKPVNPLDNIGTRARQLAGPDLQRFKKQVASSLREREAAAKR